MSERASEEFWDAVTGCGSLAIDCEHCGRTHFASHGGGDFEEGELESLQEKAKAHPEKYVEDPNADSISWGYLAGKQTVYNCPCNIARKYEGFIWEHRDIIVRYLKARTKREAEEAQRDAGALAGLGD